MKCIYTIILISTFLFTACGQQNAQSKNITKEELEAKPTPTVKAEKETTECKICDFDYKKYKGDLNQEEIKGLLLALNDEYMSWATYNQVNKDFDNPRPFINIQKAEARHAGRLKGLFEKYKMPVPENKWIGETEKYQSVKEACKAGIDAEIANAALYDKLFKSTKREDILFVYKNLQRASQENHLRAFKRCSERRGHGKGRGRGYGRGRGNN